ncbi:carbohydrate ABC transporter permease [Arthrobacter castelli]|uniref:carbohydrate ABC transporter permease n=1 Tax=Arthrobacter castelli TaxID=271431 RepID=UPI000414A837|nr:carbohydrate ABC transporter permease [Arthrobacter castelli]
MNPGRSTVGGFISRAALVFFYAFPLLWMVMTSFKSQSDILANPSGFIFAPVLDAYQTVAGDAWPAIINSTQVALGTTTVVIALAVPAAYGLVRSKHRIWARITTLLLILIIVLQMVPQAMAVIPLYGVLTQLHVVNTISGLILADAALFLPFAIVLLRPFIQSIPIELEEASIVDGASFWRTFVSVVLPLARNGIVTVCVMVFMLTWGEFIYGVTLLSVPDGYPVSSILAQQISLYGTEWNRLMALAVLTTLPILIVFLFSQKRLSEGMLRGAVK